MTFLSLYNRTININGFINYLINRKEAANGDLEFQIQPKQNRR